MSKRSLNKTLLIGCLGVDPELRYTPNDGTAVATRKQRTEWHRVVCFGRLAEIASQYLTKGSYVYFEGRMQTRQYTDRGNTERTCACSISGMGIAVRKRNWKSLSR
ncbi:MAG: single-stranded DNA-binding protein [Gammaproteobacteria bacterium]